MKNLIENLSKLHIKTKYGYYAKDKNNNRHYGFTETKDEGYYDPAFSSREIVSIRVLVGTMDLTAIVFTKVAEAIVKDFVKGISLPDSYKYITKSNDSVVILMRVLEMPFSDDCTQNPEFKLDEGYVILKNNGYVEFIGATENGSNYELVNGEFTSDDKIHTLDFKDLIDGLSAIADTSNYLKELKLLDEKKLSTKVSTNLDDESIETPCFPDSIYSQLPSLFKTYLSQYKQPRERDISLISALSVISACIPNVVSSHFNKRVWAHFYSLVIAPPASGKGVAYDSSIFYNEIEKQMKSEYELSYSKFKNDLAAHKDGRLSEKPEIPKRQTIILPTDSSFIAFFKQLQVNDGSGLMLETELDTFINAGKQEWGNYSVLNRKATHHESHYVNRKEFDVPLSVEEPKIAMLMTGTPDQFFNLFNSAENGLYSRFLIYFFKLNKIVITNPYRKFDKLKDTDKIKNELSNKVSEIFSYLKNIDKEIEFSWSEEQAEKLHDNFNKQIKFAAFYGQYSSSVVLRYMLLATRIGMVLTTIKNYENGKIKESNLLEPTNEIYEITVNIINTCINHSLLMLSNIESLNQQKPLNVKESNVLKLLKELPDKQSFKTQDALRIGHSLKMSERTVYSYIEELIKGKHIEKLNYGEYRKIK